MYRRGFLSLSLAVAVSGCLEFLEDNGEEITEPADVEIAWSDLVRDNPEPRTNASTSGESFETSAIER